MGKTRFQVFVSSTYTDLIPERQAAVEAILKAGHIPAGMELFAAGDQSQMHVIREWIDESDIFLLVLGGRYGSIEPTTGKSYVELEYEYAVEKGKVLFAVFMSDEALSARARQNPDFVETERTAEFNSFRDVVRSRICKQFADCASLAAGIYESLLDVLRKHQPRLTGWVPASEAVDAQGAMKQIADLSAESAQLRRELANARRNEPKPLPDPNDEEMGRLAAALSAATYSYNYKCSQFLTSERGDLVVGGTWKESESIKALSTLTVLGLVDVRKTEKGIFAKTTQLGNRFLAYWYLRTGNGP